MNSIYNKTIIVIVSAFSSGAMLSRLFHGRGYPCVHVTTRREWEIKRLQTYFDADSFIKNYVLNGEEDIAFVVDELKKFNVKAILPGCESGVRLADTLCQYFSVPKNDYHLIDARRNKYHMIDAIKKCHLLCAEQFKSDNLAAVLEWYKNHGKVRVVVKPLSSSSSDSVFYCHNEAEIQQAFQAIHNQLDMYNNQNSEVLIQEFLAGDEFIVNTVSRDGVHYVTDIWQGFSENIDMVSNDSYADLVHRETLIHQQLSSYTMKVLDALAIKNGAAHSEIRMTSKGPCLIETGARLAGKVNFASIESIYGYSQLSLTVEAMIEPELFKKRPIAVSSPTRYARYVYFFSNVEGDIVCEPDLSAMLAIDGVESVTFSLAKGDKLRRTSKSYRSPRPGYAYLIADTQEQLERDYAALRLVEQKLYSSILDD